MLFINGKQSNIDELLALVNKEKGTNLTRKSLSQIFKKSPGFEINPIKEMIDLGRSKREGREVKKEVKGRDVLARFGFFSTVDGVHYEVRYTATMPYKDERTQKTIYRPTAIDLAGPIHFVQDADGRALEMATFLYIHPGNSKSPLYTPGKVFIYTHLNNDDKFEQQATQNQSVLTAMQHSNTLTDVDIVIFAKSLNVPVQGLTASQARTQLQSFLLADFRNVQQYLKHMNDQSEVFVGRIIDAIDNQQIVHVSAGNSTIWSFNLPDNKSPIVSVPQGNDIRQGLINHIKGNIADFHSIIMGISRENQANLDYKSFFDKVENPSAPDKTLLQEGIVEFGDISDFKTAAEFWKQYFNKETHAPATIKKFLQSVEDGAVTQENLEESMLEFAPKS